MLVNLDVLIGLSVIMLGLSLIVTIIGQVASNALALRETNLRWGLSVLIQQLHSDRFKPPAARLPLFDRSLNKKAVSVVSKVLEYPLVSDAKVPLGRWKLASVIRFDEFVKTVALLGSSSRDADLKWLGENNRITEPWFNSMMDRVSQRFTSHMRIYTVLISVLLVLVVRVDTLHVLKTLRSDVALRSGLVSAAQTIAKSDGPPDATDQEKVKQFANSVIEQLPVDQGILSLLRPPASRTIGEAVSRLPGLFLSMMLLSLGAPFWFNMLKNLTALRPIVANKDDKERSVQTAAPDVGDRISWKDL